jgi:hypothetical protein
LFTNVQPNPPALGGFAGNLDAVEAAGVLETSLAAVEVERVFIKTSRKTIGGSIRGYPEY